MFFVLLVIVGLVGCGVMTQNIAAGLLIVVVCMLAATWDRSRRQARRHREIVDAINRKQT